MIQRVQTLFLAGVIIISIVLFFIPLSKKTITISPTETASIYTLTISEASVVGGNGVILVISYNYPILIINLLLLTLAAYAIFLFKSRKLQMRVSLIGCLLVAAELGLIYFYSEAMGNNDVKAVYEAGVYLVSGQLFLLLAARRAIKKDDMLVKAADRIR